MSTRLRGAAPASPIRISACSPGPTPVPQDFTVPAGLLRFGETQLQRVLPRMSLTVSANCGGFSRAPAEPLNAAGVVDDLAPGGSLRRIVGDTAAGFSCGLAAPKDSYCTGSCGHALQNRVSPGS